MMGTYRCFGGVSPTGIYDRYFLIRIFAAFPTRRLALRHESVQGFGDTTGVWSAYYQAVVTDRAGKATTLMGRFSATWVKQAGRWVIVHHHFSALPPAS
jgi:ketosteroid isomerase-like protein